jgi:hypothetical protein
LQQFCRECFASADLRVGRVGYIPDLEDIMQAYSNPDRESDPHALPDKESGATGGWFWWSCFPGCLPDSSAFGPFKTRAEALADARETYGDDVA